MKKNNITLILICCLCLIAQITICISIINNRNTIKNSWDIYCTLYNVDKSNPTEEEENFYLDYWLGSAESEQFLDYN